MFNFIVILNSAPLFVLAEDENQVQEIISTYKDKVHKVISGTNLKTLNFKVQFSLEQENTLLIPEVVNEETQLQLITEEEKEILSEELTNDLDT
jgi:hypothetical protein